MIAKSASDKTDDWPYWMIWDSTRGINVTGQYVDVRGRLPFVSREDAEAIVEIIQLKGDSKILV